MIDVRDRVRRLRMAAKQAQEEVKELAHDIDRQMTIANQYVNEVETLRKQMEEARDNALEEAAECAERYPSPMNDLPMALAIRSVANAIRKLKGQQHG